MTQRRLQRQRGSGTLGALFLLSIFGPMIALAILWGVAAAVGSGGGDGLGARDAIFTAMVWVGLVSAAAITAEAVAAGVLLLFRRR